MVTFIYTEEFIFGVLKIFVEFVEFVDFVEFFVEFDILVEL